MKKNLEKQLQVHLECLQEILNEDVPRAQRAASLLLIDAQEHNLEAILDPLAEQMYQQTVHLRATLAGMEMILTSLLNLAKTDDHE